MLVFGPFRSIPEGQNFTIYNLTSPTQVVNRLPGLIVDIPYECLVNGDYEKSFDIWYYNYVLNDMVACGSLMCILNSLYNGEKVYVCISEYVNDSFMSIINESFMKILQVRYDIKYSIINDPEDLDYIPQDGCDIMSVDGIKNMDDDRNRYMQLCTESQLLSGTYRDTVKDNDPCYYNRI